jgi:hypothetical protein
MIIKSFKIFEGGKSITNIEVKNIIDDVLVDLTDLNDKFYWDSYITNDNNLFEDCNLRIKCIDEKIFTTIDRIHVSKNIEWIEILERLFYILSSEGIKIIEKKELYIDVKPGKIDLGWSFKRNLFSHQAWWEKEFIFLS